MFNKKLASSNLTHVTSWRNFSNILALLRNQWIITYNAIINNLLSKENERTQHKGITGPKETLTPAMLHVQSICRAPAPFCESNNSEEQNTNVRAEQSPDRNELIGWLDVGHKTVDIKVMTIKVYMTMNITFSNSHRLGRPTRQTWVKQHSQLPQPTI